MPENVGEKAFAQLPTGSVAKGLVEYGDTAWTQVDFYFSSDDIKEETINLLQKSYPEARVSQVKIGDINVTKIQYLLDKGQVTKAGTGGSDYVFNLEGAVKTIKISKQAQGDQEFENSFYELISSLTFD